MDRIDPQIRHTGRHPPALGVAVFDFDRTLVRQGSLGMVLHALLGTRRYLSACGAAAAAAVFSPPRLWRETYRKTLLRRALSGRKIAEIHAAAARIFPRLDWRPEAMGAYARHRAAGRHILIASGSLSCYLPLLLQLKDLRADGLLATEMAVEDGVLTGALAAPACTGEEKARRVRQWLDGTDGEIWSYGNLPHDAAMLALSQHPTVIPARHHKILKPFRAREEEP